MLRNILYGLTAFLVFGVIASYLLRSQIAREQAAAIKADPAASLFEKEDEIIEQSGMPPTITPDPDSIPEL